MIQLHFRFRGRYWISCEKLPPLWWRQKDVCRLKLDSMIICSSANQICKNGTGEGVQWRKRKRRFRTCKHTNQTHKTIVLVIPERRFLVQNSRQKKHSGYGCLNEDETAVRFFSETNHTPKTENIFQLEAQSSKSNTRSFHTMESTNLDLLFSCTFASRSCWRRHWKTTLRACGWY